MAEPGVVGDGKQKIGVGMEIGAHLLAQHDLITDGAGKVVARRLQLRLQIVAAAEGGHRQIEEGRQRTQQVLQRHELAERHQMVFLVAVHALIAVGLLAAQHDHRVVVVIAVLLQAGIDDAGDQRAAALA